MRYLNQYHGFIELENGLQIHDYEVLEYHLKHNVTVSLNEVHLLMEDEQHMDCLLEGFPFFIKEHEVRGVGDDLFYIRVNKLGRKIVMLSEVADWVKEHRKDEVKAVIEKEYKDKKNFNYGFMDAVSFVSKLYFEDKLTSYLIWNV